MIQLHIIEYAYEFIENQISPDKLADKTIYVVRNNKLYKWVLMKCPCGCNDLITLSLMKSHKPNWRIKFDLAKRISLSPSIWKKDGCRSHFFISKSKLKWAYNF